MKKIEDPFGKAARYQLIVGIIVVIIIAIVLIIQHC
jgi:hypothetical protein